VSLPDLGELRGGATPRDYDVLDAARLADSILAEPQVERLQRKADLERTRLGTRTLTNEGHPLQGLDRGHPDA